VHGGKEAFSSDIRWRSFRSLILACKMCLIFMIYCTALGGDFSSCRNNRTVTYAKKHRKTTTSRKCSRRTSTQHRYLRMPKCVSRLRLPLPFTVLGNARLGSADGPSSSHTIQTTKHWLEYIKLIHTIMSLRKTDKPRVVFLRTSH
jgi:hypothetical protein